MAGRRTQARKTLRLSIAVGVFVGILAGATAFIVVNRMSPQEDPTVTARFDNYDIPVRSDGELAGIAQIPVDVGDCISERFAELGLTPTDPNFNSTWAAFVAANAEACAQEHQ